MLSVILSGYYRLADSNNFAAGDCEQRFKYLKMRFDVGDVREMPTKIQVIK